MKSVFVPASKSISNRALLLAALSEKPTILRRVLVCDDTRYMREGLEAFGVRFEDLGHGDLRITPPGEYAAPETEIFIGNAGTAARFLSALSLVLDRTFSLTGVERMKQRPFEDLFLALGSLGVKVDSLEKETFLPARFEGPGKGQTVSLSGKVSSQFLSGLLLVAPKLPGGLTVEIIDEIPSLPYVQMTVRLLEFWGAKVEVSDDGKRFVVGPGLQTPGEYTVPADMSSASYPIMYSLLSRKPLVLENFGSETLQGDEQFLVVAEKFGAKVIRSAETVEIHPPEVLQPLGTIDFSSLPDVSMTAMALAGFADGLSIFTGLESLRVKECDRIGAMEQLRQLGPKISVREGDEVRVWGDPTLLQKPARFKDAQGKWGSIASYDDHRIAMVFGVLQEVLEVPFTITNPSCVAKTWPNFWQELADWGDHLRQVAASIVQKDSQYLIVRKPRERFAWQFPQGGIEKGETGLEAAKRELAEECGEELRVAFGGDCPVGDYKYLFPEDFDRHDENIKGARVSFFRANYVSGEVHVDGEEIVEAKWASAQEIGEHFEKVYGEEVKEFLG